MLYDTSLSSTNTIIKTHACNNDSSWSETQIVNYTSYNKFHLFKSRSVYRNRRPSHIVQIPYDVSIPRYYRFRGGALIYPPLYFCYPFQCVVQKTYKLYLCRCSVRLHGKGAFRFPRLITSRLPIVRVNAKHLPFSLPKLIISVVRSLIKDMDGYASFSQL